MDAGCPHHVITQEYWLDNYSSHPGWGKDSRQARAIAILLRDHVRSDKLGETCKRVQFGFRKECETFLRTVIEKNPHKDVQGQACLRLALFLNGRLNRLDLLKEQPDLNGAIEGLYGQDYLDALRRQDRAKAVAEVEAVFEQAAEKYGDVKLPFGGTVGDNAKTELFAIRHLAVGKEAADIEGPDQNGVRFKLSDYRGKVVLLYFWQHALTDLTGQLAPRAVARHEVERPTVRLDRRQRQRIRVQEPQGTNGQEKMNWRSFRTRMRSTPNGTPARRSTTSSIPRA